MKSADISPSQPCCVDLDGTLLRGDLLYENLLIAFKHHPWRFLSRIWSLGKGRGHFKEQLQALWTTGSMDRLPYNLEVVNYLREQKKQGRKLVLVTASHRALAEKVAEHLGLFSEVIASHGGRNLSGSAKRDELVSRFGEKGYVYFGNNDKDFVVWRSASAAGAVGLSDRQLQKLKAQTPIEAVFPASGTTGRDALHALRIHHWLKNILIFIPLVTSHTLLQADIFWPAVRIFFAFSFFASCIYIVNDLFDLDADRGHAVKKARPFAAGRLSVSAGVGLAVGCLALGLLLAPAPFSQSGPVLIGYFLLSLFYTLRGKQIVLLDVFILAGLYTLRIIAGHAVTGIAFSPWLLSFSIFFFMSLAFTKRFSELYRLPPTRTQSPGRGYQKDDLPLIAVFGVTSGFLSSLVLSLYTASDAVAPLYREPIWLFLLVPLISYWQAHIWLHAHRGLLTEDSIQFAAKDRVSYGVMAAGVLVILVATYGVPGMNPAFLHGTIR